MYGHVVAVKDIRGLKKGTGLAARLSFFGGWAMLFTLFYLFPSLPFFISSYYLFISVLGYPWSFPSAGQEWTKEVKGRADNEVMHTHHCEATSDNFLIHNYVSVSYTFSRIAC